MKQTAALLGRELRDLFVAPGTCACLVVLSVLLGVGMHGALGSRPGTEEGADFFRDSFRHAYVWFAFLLPAVLAGVVSRDREFGAAPVLGLFAGPGKVFGAKLMSIFAFLAICMMMSLPGVLHRVMAGAAVGAADLATLYTGYSLHILLAAALSLAASALIRRRNAALASASLVLLAVYGAGGAAGAIGLELPEWADPLRLLAGLENGIFSLYAIIAFGVPSMVLLALTWALMTPDRKRRTRRTAAVAICAAAVIVAAVISGSLLGGHGRGGVVRDVRTLLAVAMETGKPAMPLAEDSYRKAHAAHLKTLKGPDHEAAPSERGRQGILVFYCVAIPFMLIFLSAARRLRRSRMPEPRKTMILVPATWLAIVLFFALVQDHYMTVKEWQWFPSVRDVLPVRQFSFLRFSGGDDAKGPAPGGAKEEAVILHAGENHRHLKRFFGKLSDLKAGRRGTVRIVHYGDSLIWGDCFSRTMKRSFQKEFGDGGRGIVPPVATLPTTLQDHVNRTAGGGFGHHAVMHEFRYGGVFHERPRVNAYVGFTGEGAYIRNRSARIRMEVPAGSALIQRVRVFLRSHPSSEQTSLCEVRLEGGSGPEIKPVAIPPGGAGIIDFSIPPSGEITIDVECAGGPGPSVDAINLESSGGVAYSTVVRMGIHMAWMNAIPERNMEGLRAASPDLVVFQFGINEAASRGGYPEFSHAMLRGQMREWFDRIKQTIPGADVLVIGPPERLRPRAGGLAPMQEMLEVREVQREEALRAGFAFYDTYAALGGEGHMLRLAQSGMAMNDYTHFTMRGGDFAAEGLYASLMDAYHNRSGPSRLDLRLKERAAILFNSASYAYFLCAVLLALAIASRRPGMRHAVILAASLAFYATFAFWPILCLAATISIDYAMAILIGRARKHGGRGTGFLAASLAGNLGILFVFKYFDFFSGLAGRIALAAGHHVQMPALNILLPVGISFYTFQSMSYTIDVWRGKLEPERRPLTYAHYVSMFTQILSGPIVKAREFLPALRERAGHFRVTREHAATALFLILAGLIKKGGADWIAGAVVDRVYASPQMFLPLETLTAVYAYGVQIYGDFSGYTDIAIGSAMLLGYRIPENFRRPYASLSVSEFWQRWHMTLGGWLREYLYISLGGNRKRVFFNIFATMLICGLWHGAALTFVAWGVYHGLFMIAERAMKLNRGPAPGRLLRSLRVFITLHIVLFGWVIFRCDSWETFTGILGSFAGSWGAAPNVGPLMIAVIAAFYALHYTPAAWKERLRARWSSLPAEAQGAAAAAVTLFLYRIASAQAVPFIYFRF